MSDLVLVLPILLLSVVAHEYAHAWTANRQGDGTAREAGRLTLNPLPHIDPVMSVAFPLLLWLATSAAGHPFTLGSARPVPVDPRRFRRPVRGDIIVSSAGVGANLALALASTALFALAGLAGAAAPAAAGALHLAQRALAYGLVVNLTLAFFNLVPIPPLDGSHLAFHALPRRWRDGYRRLARFGFLVLLATFFVPGVWDVLLWPVDFLSSAAFEAVRPLAIQAAP